MIHQLIHFILAMMRELQNTTAWLVASSYLANGIGNSMNVPADKMVF